MSNLMMQAQYSDREKREENNRVQKRTQRCSVFCVHNAYVYTYAHMCICTRRKASIHPSISPFIHPSVRPSVYPQPFRLSLYSCIRPSILPSITQPKVFDRGSLRCYPGTIISSHL